MDIYWKEIKFYYTKKIVKQYQKLFLFLSFLILSTLSSLLIYKVETAVYINPILYCTQL